MARRRVSSRKQHEVIAFDDEYEGGIFLNIIKRTVEDAGWRAHMFEDVEQARRQVTNTLGAVVTGLGVPRKKGPNSSIAHTEGLHSYPAEPLIDITHTLGRPLAIISDHPHASDYIKPANGDVVLPRHPYHELPDKLLEWLRVVIVPAEK